MMKPAVATTSRLGRRNAKLLVIDNNQTSHFRLHQLPDLLPKDGLIVVNTAATLPASFRGYIRGEGVELRLISNSSASLRDISNWRALIYHRGSWKELTEDRESPYFIEVGDIITIGDLKAEILSIDHHSKKIISIRFLGSISTIWAKIYRYGVPIQYSHLDDQLHLWDVQTIFSSIPVAVEPPSASFQLSWDIIHRLIANGMEITGISHATSISSTGIEDVDISLPFPERYWINQNSAKIITRYHNQERPIIAIGTSVVRALEDNFARFGTIQSGSYQTDLRIDTEFERSIVSGLFTGMHLPEESHVDLLHNFVSPTILDIAYSEAMEKDYLWHEYGDVNLILSTI